MDTNNMQKNTLSVCGKNSASTNGLYKQLIGFWGYVCAELTTLRRCRAVPPQQSAKLWRMTFVFFAVFFVRLSIGAEQGLVGDEEDLCAKIPVSVVCADSACVRLNVSIENRKDRPIMLSTSNLPWNSRTQLHMAITTLLPLFEPVEAGVWTDRNSPGITEIQHGAQISGTIDVLERFPEIQGRIGRDRFVLVWVARISDIYGELHSACTGSMFIGRGPLRRH